MTRFHFNFFRCRDAKGHLKEIYTHFTCATDTTNIQVQLGRHYTHTHIIPSDPCHIIFCHWPLDLDTTLCTAPHCACSWLMSCKYWGDSTAVVEQILLVLFSISSQQCHELDIFWVLNMGHFDSLCIVHLTFGATCFGSIFCCNNSLWFILKWFFVLTMLYFSLFSTQLPTWS